MDSFREIVNTLGNYLSDAVIPIIVALAILVFMGNVAFFIANMSNEKEREQFKKYSLNSLLALFLLFAVWGVIGIFTQTIFQKQPFIPQLPTSVDGEETRTTTPSPNPNPAPSGGGGGTTKSPLDSLFGGFKGGSFGGGGAGGGW